MGHLTTKRYRRRQLTTTSDNIIQIITYVGRFAAVNVISLHISRSLVVLHSLHSICNTLIVILFIFYLFVAFEIEQLFKATSYIYLQVPQYNSA